MDSTTHEDFKWLMSNAAAELLQQTQAKLIDRINPLRIAKSLRKKTIASRAAMVMDQASLRIRARTKFTAADAMFFTRRGLEQSTGEDLARYKGARFEGIPCVADVCCGIGGDLIGLAGRDGAFATTGIDSDPLTAMFARHNANMNLPAHEQATQVLPIDFAALDLSLFSGIHCDPDRRVSERTVVGSRFSPPLDEVFQHIGPRKNLAIKIAPATSPSQNFPATIEREWIGDRRECKQQVIWHGPNFERRGKRTATFVDGDQVHQISVPEEEVDITVEVSNQIRQYLFEPHPTVLAAGLNNVLARQCNLARLAVDVEYLTSDQPVEHPILARFEIIETFPLNLRRTVEFLKKHDVGTVEVKKRGVGKVLFDQFERMRISGPNRATVILTRIGTQRIVAIARRTRDDFPI